MSSDDIDRLLREDRNIEPSPYFAGNVMRAVRRSVDDRAAIAFPWKRLVPGLAVCVAAIVAGAIGGAPGIPPEVASRAAENLARFQVVTWVPAAIAGTYLLVWWSMRVAAR